MELIPEKIYYIDLPRVSWPSLEPVRAHIGSYSATRRAVKAWWLKNSLEAMMLVFALALAVAIGFVVSGL
jgi:hypothetical protein